MHFGLKATGFFLVLTLAACSSDPAGKESKNEQAVEVQTAKVDYTNRLNEYKKIVESLDRSNVESVTKAAEGYSELMKGGDPEICDQAFVIFHNLYEDIALNLNEKILKDTAIQNSTCAYVDDNGKKIPPSKALQKLESKISKHGYRIECWEGMPGIGLERDFIAQNFYKSVSPAMRRFLNGLQENEDKVAQIDAGIILTEKEYVDRTVWWETFVKENPDFILIERAKEMKKYYFTFLIFGMDNTPAISYTTEVNGEETISDLSDYFVTAYTYLNKKYPDSETNKLVKPFFKAAKAQDFDKVERIRKDYTKKGYMIDFEKEYQ